MIAGAGKRTSAAMKMVTVINNLAPVLSPAAVSADPGGNAHSAGKNQFGFLTSAVLHLLWIHHHCSGWAETQASTIRESRAVFRKTSLS